MLMESHNLELNYNKPPDLMLSNNNISGLPDSTNGTLNVHPFFYETILLSLLFQADAQFSIWRLLALLRFRSGIW